MPIRLGYFVECQARSFVVNSGAVTQNSANPLGLLVCRILDDDYVTGYTVENDFTVWPFSYIACGQLKLKS